MDGDDVIYFKLLEMLHDLIEKTHSQIAISQYYSGEVENFKKQVIPAVCSNTIESFTYLDNQKTLDCFIRGVYKEFPALCGKLILRSAVQNILFDESLQNGEDTKFIYLILRNEADAVILHQNGYYYRQHENSVSKIGSIKAYHQSIPSIFSSFKGILPLSIIRDFKSNFSKIFSIRAFLVL